jgi:hypothetical protein
MNKEIEVGLLIDANDELKFFGLDEINKLITEGGKVCSIEAGGVIMEQVNSDDEGIEVSISGFKLKVKILPSP